ncbi:MAG: hypothetical protein IBX64_12380 [Actinobacteria bacterium]|nr:hypothetical protein [Actinomycetota bacterium]
MAKKTFKANLVGMSYCATPFQIHDTVLHAALQLEREPDNLHDQNAVKVLVSGYKVGYLDRKSAQKVGNLIEKGAHLIIKVADSAINPTSKAISLVVEAELNTVKPDLPICGTDSGIYRISINSGHWMYVGQSIEISKRLLTHWKDLNFECHNNIALQEKWRQFGESSFVTEVLEIAPKGMSDLERQRWLGEREDYWIKETKKISICLNLKDAEIVTTKKAKAEFDILAAASDKQHDERVRERKKEIKLEIKILESELSKSNNQKQVVTKNVYDLKNFISSNTGIRGFFFWIRVKRHSKYQRKGALSGSFRP